MFSACRTVALKLLYFMSKIFRNLFTNPLKKLTVRVLLIAAKALLPVASWCFSRRVKWTWKDHCYSTFYWTYETLAIVQFNRSMGEIASKSFLFCPGQIHVSGLRVKQFQITKVNQGKNAKLIRTYFLLTTGYGTHLVLIVLLHCLRVWWKNIHQTLIVDVG